MASLLFDPTLACFDAGPDCVDEASAPPLWWLLTRGAIWGAVLALGVAAIALAWRHRRGRTSRAVALLALAAPALAIVAAGRVVWIPLLPF